MFRNIKTIAAKEIKDALRDSSSLHAALIYALIGPIMLFFAFIQMNNAADSVVDRDIMITGPAQTSIELYLDEEGFNRANSSEITLHIPENFEKLISANQQVTLVIKADMAKSASTVSLLRKSINSFSDKVVSDRLESNGLSTELVEPLKIDTKNTGPLSAQNDMIVKLITFGFFAAVAATAMSLAIDLTAGERERLSFEPLLAQPVSTGEIMLGKWLVTFVQSVLGVILAIVLYALIMANMSPADFTIRIDFISGVQIFLLLLPLSALFASLQLALALYAKTYKEGITYLGLLAMLPMFAPFLPISIRETMPLLPLLSEAGAIKDIMTGTSFIGPTSVGAVILALVLAAAALYYSQWRLKQETVFS